MIKFFSTLFDLDRQVLSYGVDVLHNVCNRVDIFLALVDYSLIKLLILLHPLILITYLKLLLLHLAVKIFTAVIIDAIAVEMCCGSGCCCCCGAAAAEMGCGSDRIVRLLLELLLHVWQHNVK